MLRIVQHRSRQKQWLVDTSDFLSAPCRRRIADALDDMRARSMHSAPHCSSRRARAATTDAASFASTPRDADRRRIAWRALGQRPCRRRTGARPRARALGDGRAPRLGRGRRLSPPRRIITKIRSSRGACSRHSIPPSHGSRGAATSRARSQKACRWKGILAVEMFLTRRTERLLINELAPRPHNRYHASERACVDEPVRAACARSLRPSARRHRCDCVRPRL